MARRQRGILDILSSAQRGRVSTSIQTTPSRASAPIYAQRLSARKKAEEARAEQLRSGIKRQNTISQVYRAASNAAKQRRGALDLMQDKMNRAYSTETRGDLLRGAYRSARTSGFDAKRAISNGGRNANVQKALAGLGGDEFGMGGRTLYRRGDSAGNVRNLTRHSNAYRRKVEAGVNDGGIFAPRSRIPTKEELEARQKYGFSKQYADYFNNLANSDRTVTLAKGQEPHVQPRGSFFRAPTKDIAINPDRYKLGLAESLMFNAPEKTASEQYGTALDEEGLAEARKSGSYMLGLGTGEGLQFMATAPLAAPIEAGIAGRTTLQGASRLGKVWKGVRSGKDAAKAYGSSVAAQEIVSLPINFIDALKENKGREGDWKRVAARFGLNQALDLFMASAMELPGLSRNIHFANAQKYFDSARLTTDAAVRDQLRTSAVHELSQLDNRTMDAVKRYLVEERHVPRSMPEQMDMVRGAGPGERVTGENAFMRQPVETPQNVGYHAGDLGKAETFFNMATSSRGTGHFGTGTYFVGDKALIGEGTGYAARPKHTIDFDGYHLYKPESSEQGMEVHEALRQLNRDPQGLVRRLDMADNIEDVENFIHTAEYTPDNLTRIETIANDTLDRDTMENLRRWSDDPETYFNEMLYELEARFDRDNVIHRPIQEDLADEREIISTLARDLGKSDDEVRTALREAANTVATYGDPYRTAGQDLDSASTVFMKNLGFEGVDTRGLKGLDNVQYGSVIYDLKPKDSVEISTNPRYNESTGGAANGEPVERAGAGPSDLRGTADEVPTSGRPEADSAGVGTRPIIPEHEAATGNGGHVLLSEEQRKILTDSGVTDTHQGGADYATFSKALSDGRNANEYGGYVDPQSVDDLTKKGAKTFLSDDGKSGVGIAGDGDIFGVFKNPDSKYPDAVKDLLITARANGGTKMDCYGRVLANNYEKGGYVPVGRVKFSEEIARMNLEDGVINQEQFDVLMREKPDIYFMMKNTDSLDDVIRKMANGEYHQSTQEELDALELFDDVVENGETVYGYDRATEARNNALAKQEGGAAEATPEESRIKVDGRELNEVEQDIYDKAYKKAAEKKVNGKPQGEGEAAEKAAKKAVRQQRNRIKKEGKEWIATEEHTSTGEAADFDNEWYERKLQDGKIPSYERGKNGEPSDVEHALNAIKRLLKTDQFKSIRKEVKVAIENGLFDRRVKHIQEYIDKAIREVENDPRKALDDILQYHPTGPKAGDVPADSIPWVTKAFVLTKWAEQHGYKGLQMDIASTVAKAQSSAGGMLRGGQIFTVMANKKTQREVIEKTMKDLTERFAKRLDGHELTMSDELWERLANAKTKQETADVLEDMSVHIWNQIPMGFMESLDTVRFMGMLSNPRTQIRNVVGNIGFVPPRLIKDGIATGYERILEAAGAIERSDRTHSVYNPFTKDSKEKLAYWDKMFQENKAEIMGHNRFDDNAASSSISTSRPMEARHWGIKAGGGTSKNPLSAGAEGIYQLTTKGLEGGDRIFLESSYKDSATKYMNARGWSLDDLTPARKAEIHAHAMQQAQKATYRDASELATLLSRWGRWEKGDGGAKFVRSIGVNSLMPFKKTPINVTKRAVEYSPAEVLKGTYDLVTGLKSGNKELIVQSADELASMTTGTGLVALGFWLAKNGVMNGELPTDEEGFIRKDLGEQDYAMTIGGKTISMDWFAPGIIPVMTGVSLYEMTKDQGLKDLTPDKIFDLISGSMQPMVEISFMQGTSNFLDTIGSEKGADKITAGSLQLALGYAGQIVPTMLGQINRTFFDPVRRDTASYAEGSTQRTIEKHINKAKAKIPGASKTLPAYVDFKGEEQVEESLPRRFFENFISPATIKDLNKDPVYKKMLDLQHKYPGEKVLPDNSLGTAKNKISFDGGQVTLDAKQMEQYKRNRGKANDDALREVLNNSELSDKDKLGALEDSYKKAKVGAKQKALLDMGKDEWKVYTDDFTGGKAEPDIYNAAKDAGIDAKTYYDYMSDPKVADKEFGDGNGYNSKQEMVNYLLSQEDLTNAQRAALLAGFNKRYADAKYNPFLNGTASYEDVSGGSKSGRSSGGSGRRSSGRRSSGSRSKSSKGREQTASEKAFAALHSSSAMGKRKQTNYAKYKTLTVAQRKAILKALRG